MDRDCPGLYYVDVKNKVIKQALVYSVHYAQGTLTLSVDLPLCTVAFPWSSLWPSYSCSVTTQVLYWTLIEQHCGWELNLSVTASGRAIKSDIALIVGTLQLSDLAVSYQPRPNSHTVAMQGNFICQNTQDMASLETKRLNIIPQNHIIKIRTAPLSSHARSWTQLYSDEVTAIKLV